MTTFRTTAIAAIAAVTIAASMASPAQALSTGEKIGLGIGAFALGAAAASAHAHGGYYGGGHGHYGEGRHYRRAARKCARRWGWHTWKWERCMDRRGF